MGSREELPEKLMRRYLDCLEEERYEEAVEQFAPDVRYDHPLLEEPIRGRDSLLEFFAEDRDSREGSEGMDHVFESWVVEGDEFVVKGSMEGTTGGTQFVAYGELTDGKISYYVPGLLEDIWRDG